MTTDTDVFSGLQLRKKQLNLLGAVNRHHPFAGCRVLEIGSDSKLQAAQAMLRLGAKEVFAVNPGFRKETLEMSTPGITTVTSPAEELDCPDHYFDIIFGVALLEHVHHPRELARQCSRLLEKRKGFCLLQGSPVWTSHQGHHIICHLGDRYIRPDTNPPLDDWQHLCLTTHGQAAQAFGQHGFTGEESAFLAKKLLDDPHISRKTPSAILDCFRGLPGMTLVHARSRCNRERTPWYREACGRYDPVDLDTRELKIMLWHTRPVFREIAERLSCRRKVQFV